MPESAVLAAERHVIAAHFNGSRTAYLQALSKRRATVAIARAIIRDDLRRRAYAAQLQAAGSAQAPLEALAERSTAVLAGATCLRDDLPGWGWFPGSDDRQVVVPTLARKLPFLLDDRTAPAPPTGVAATVAEGVVQLSWTSNGEADLAGYAVYRAPAPGGPWAPRSVVLMSNPYFEDTPPPGKTFYVVRAVDTSGNVSGPSTPAVVAGR